MEKSAKIYVAGHNGMVGSAVVRRLREEGYTRLILRTRAELDLIDQKVVRVFLQEETPEYVFYLCGQSG